MAVFLSVLSVILTVLKVIGIVLLCVIGLVLAILLIVLFVPVRYGGDGYFKMDESGNDYAFKAKASWLLHIVSVFFDIKDPSGVVIKIFGIKLGGKKDKPTEGSKAGSRKKKKHRKTEAVDEVENCAGVETLSVDETEADEGKETDSGTANEAGAGGEAETETAVGAESEANAESETESEAEDSGKGRKRRGKFKDKHGKKTGKKPKDKKDFDSRGLYDKIKRYLDIIRSDDFKYSFALCKKMVGKLLKAILPKKWELNGSVGFEDPSLTGYVCALTGAMYMWLRKHIHITGKFEAESNDIDLNGYFKGRIFVITLVYVFLKIWFNKKIRRVLDLFKDEPEGENLNE